MVVQSTAVFLLSGSTASSQSGFIGLFIRRLLPTYIIFRDPLVTTDQNFDIISARSGIAFAQILHLTRSTGLKGTCQWGMVTNEFLDVGFAKCR